MLRCSVIYARLNFTPYCQVTCVLTYDAFSWVQTSRNVLLCPLTNNECWT